jgi:hypothetical protein
MSDAFVGLLLIITEQCDVVDSHAGRIVIAAAPRNSADKTDW